MAGTKRTHDNMDGNTNSKQDETSSSSAPVSTSEYIPMFEYFRTELDEHHDRRERVMKASKDITANSKKIIFALQRVKTLGRSISDKRVIGDVDRLTKAIHDLFVAVAPDLQGIDAHRYQRNISGGIQEYMEAVLFRHYLETQKLMDYTAASKTIPGGVMLTYEDYALGLLDVTGELMRFAVTMLATRGEMLGSGSILTDMQSLRSELESINVAKSYSLSKDFESKLKVTRQSVEKVENGVYGMIVRGKERPPGWTPDLSASGGGGSEQIESY